MTENAGEPYYGTGSILFGLEIVSEDTSYGQTAFKVIDLGLSRYPLSIHTEKLVAFSYL
jgi:hypothetical protein